MCVQPVVGRRVADGDGQGSGRGGEGSADAGGRVAKQHLHVLIVSQSIQLPVVSQPVYVHVCIRISGD